MKIVVCHSYYRLRGGEDLSFEDEVRLLEAAGHDVIRYLRRNESLQEMSPWRAAAKMSWNSKCYREMRALLRRERPDVLHCTNTFPLISPSVLHAASAERIPVVQALRNYRFTCLNSFLCRDGAVCEQCLDGQSFWPGIRHGCYRNNRLASVAAATMLTLHRGLGTWHRHVAAFYTLTEFARAKLIAAGLPAERIHVKPNFIAPDPGIGAGDGRFAVFAGRLSEEKGIRTLLQAWERVRGLPLKVIGEGPLADDVVSASRELDIEYLGPRSQLEVLEWMGRATTVIMPSLWYETFGRTIIEAYAKGTPVIASRLGAMAELVHDGVTGRLFLAGDAADLADKVSQVANSSIDLAAMRTAAREAYLERYTAAANYEHLMRIYAHACGETTRAQEPERHEPSAAAVGMSDLDGGPLCS